MRFTGLLTFGADPIPCQAEKEALSTCTGENSTWQTVTGSYAECSYGPGTIRDCFVECEVGTELVWLQCDGTEGLPMRCWCSVEGDRNFRSSGVIYADDCAEAALEAAEGECTNRLECCIEYVSESDGEERCTYGSDPPPGTGYSSCENAAEDLGGRIVPICPLYTQPLLPSSL